MIRPTINYADVERITKDGPPMLVSALGRLFGIGPAERRALGAEGIGGVPGWSWGLLGVGVGFVVGVRVYKRWPNKVPRLIRGGESHG